MEEGRQPETPNRQPEKLGEAAGKLWWVRDASWPPLGSGVVLVQSHDNLLTLPALLTHSNSGAGHHNRDHEAH